MPKKKKKSKQLNFQVLGLDDFYQLYETAEGKRFFNGFFKDSYYLKPKEGRIKIHKAMETGEKLLVGFYEIHDRERPVGLISFTERPGSLNTVKTFVDKKFRRQGIAGKLTDHLIGMARSKDKFIYRPLQSEEMVALARKRQVKPRMMYRKGKVVGPAESVHVTDKRLANVAILPRPARAKAKKSPLFKLAERLKKVVKKPR